MGFKMSSFKGSARRLKPVVNAKTQKLSAQLKVADTRADAARRAWLAAEKEKDRAFAKAYKLKSRAEALHDKWIDLGEVAADIDDTLYDATYPEVKTFQKKTKVKGPKRKMMKSAKGSLLLATTR